MSQNAIRYEKKLKWIFILIYFEKQILSFYLVLNTYSIAQYI